MVHPLFSSVERLKLVKRLYLDSEIFYKFANKYKTHFEPRSNEDAELEERWETTHINRRRKSTYNYFAMKVKMYSAKIETVNKALDLLRSRQSSKAAKDYKKMTSKIDKQAALHCSSSKMHNSRYRKKKKVASSGFSRALIAIEMRKCLMRHDLAHVAELSSLLLEGRIETEPLVWRYLVTELLYSSKSSPITLNHFLEMCVGSQSSNFFNDILTLSSPAEAICEEELL